MDPISLAFGGAKALGGVLGLFGGGSGEKSKWYTDPYLEKGAAAIQDFNTANETSRIGNTSATLSTARENENKIVNQAYGQTSQTGRVASDRTLGALRLAMRGGSGNTLMSTWGNIDQQYLGNKGQIPGMYTNLSSQSIRRFEEEEPSGLEKVGNLVGNLPKYATQGNALSYLFKRGM